MLYSSSRYALLIMACCSLSSCALLAVGAGVTAGTAAVQEGGVSRAASDLGIQTQINDLWFRHNFDMFSKLDLTIKQGRVLITGVVQDPQHRVEAVRLAWKPKGVVQVINEITVADSAGIVGYANDTWIITRLRSALLFDRTIQSVNYSIDTVQGTVYLMGYAQNQQELDKAIHIARNIPRVKRVASYVKLVGEPAVVQSSPIGQTPQVNVPQQAQGDPIEWSQESVY